jgi:transcriptional regulator with XRE-family HTH domain
LRPQRAAQLGVEMRRSRVAKNLTQARVGALVGASQSQISSFEAGDEHALAGDKVAKFAELIGFDMSAFDEALRAAAATTAWCANPNCPTNEPYLIAERVALRPRMVDATRQRFCVFCGDELQKQCPRCGASASAGAFCSACGAPLVRGELPREELEREDAANYEAQRRRLILGR